MKEALSVISEIRDSERLRRFLATGADRKDFLYFLMHIALIRWTFSGRNRSTHASRYPSRVESAW